jgi:hypothetical protein
MRRDPDHRSLTQHMAAEASLREEHRRRWPGVEVLGFDRSAALYGTGGEPINVVLELDDTPGCRFRLAVTADQRVESLAIEAPDSDLPPARILQRVRYGELRDAAIAYVRLLLDRVDPSSGPSDLIASNEQLRAEWAREFVRRPRPGSAGRDDHWYAQLARSYVDAYKADPRRVLVELKTRLEQQDDPVFLSVDQLRDLVREARRRELLTKPPRPRGVGGGALTPKAIELLKGGND